MAFLAKNGAEGEDIALRGASLAREQELNGWDGAESQVGEDLSEQDGVLEVGDGEIVLAGCDRLFPCADEEGVGGDGMQFLLLMGMSMKAREYTVVDTYIFDGHDVFD